MKEKFLELAEKVKDGDVSEKDLPVELLKLFNITRSDKYSNERTLNDFIIDSIRISDEKRKLPFNIVAPNGEEFYPEIKMKFENHGSAMLGDCLEKMVVVP